jgi:hypothetical protein
MNAEEHLRYDKEGTTDKHSLSMSWSGRSLTLTPRAGELKLMPEKTSIRPND